MANPLIIATDGSALGNPGPTGWCWFVDDENWQAGGLPHGTNNIGELLAVRNALEVAASLGRPATVETDSQYVIQAVTKWAHGWKRNGWVTKAGAPVANREIIEPILILLADVQADFVWIKGHAGHPRNESADKRARDAAARARGGARLLIGPGYRV